jgi:hypothetical protein
MDGSLERPLVWIDGEDARDRGDCSVDVPGVAVECNVVEPQAADQGKGVSFFDVCVMQGRVELASRSPADVQLTDRLFSSYRQTAMI